MSHPRSRFQRYCPPLILTLGLLLAAPVWSDEPQALPRQIVLEGARNFRDLGGYATADGRHVKFGQLYRADNLSTLSPQDWTHLRQLGLKRVVDFRADEEIAATPPGLPADMELQLLPIGLSGLNVEDFRQRLLAGQIDNLPLSDSYSSIAFNQAGAYRTWLATLLDEKAPPSVFHCTSGKDRTGLGAAFFLLALGVPRQTVLDDFEASNRFLKPGIDAAIDRLAKDSALAKQEGKLRTLLGVRRAQMEATLTAIETRYGSIDRYLEDALGLDAGKRQQLRARYLE